MSKVLNNKEIRITPQKRNEILQAAQKLEYVPNMAASNLKRGRNGTVAILVPDLSDPFFPKLSKCIIEALEQASTKAILYDYNHQIDRVEKILYTLRDQSVDGVILIASVGLLREDSIARTKKIFQVARLPLVLVGGEGAVDSVSTVSTDTYQAGIMATKHLCDLGHKKIGFIAADDVAPEYNGFFRGYLHQLKAQGISPQESWIAKGYLKYDGGFYAANQLLTQDLTAIVAQSDQLALGAISSAIQKHIRVPKQLSVVGMDDMIMGRIFPVALTTVRQSTLQMADLIVETLTKQIETGTGDLSSVSNTHIVLKPRLIVRTSTGRVNNNE